MSPITEKINEIIAKARFRLGEENVTTAKLGEIVKISLAFSKGNYKALINGFIIEEDIQDTINQYLDLIMLIVEANYKAHQILNPTLRIFSIEEQYAEELVSPWTLKLKERYPNYKF